MTSQPSEREERLEEALCRIQQWADAYPTAIFPVPDDGYMQRAHDVLKAHGMTVDRISADAMRHALYGIGRIARAALKEKPQMPDSEKPATVLCPKCGSPPPSLSGCMADDCPTQEIIGAMCRKTNEEGKNS